MSKQIKAPADADTRFKDAIPLEKFRKLHIGIAGLGAVGRNVAILLGAIGTHHLFGADPDRIEIVNVGPQGWDEKEVGFPKAQVIDRTVLSSRTTMTAMPCKFEEMKEWIEDLDVFFCCVDTMAARQTIWTAVESRKKKGGLWFDSRMATKVIRILSADLSSQEDKETYRSSLFSDTKAYKMSCTDRMTLYGAYIAAGLLVSQLVNHLNFGMILKKDFIMETMAMSVTDLRGNEEDD